MDGIFLLMVEYTDRAIRKWRLWEQHFRARRDAPPKGWYPYLRAAWCRDEWKEAYDRYLLSHAWKQRRDGAIKRANKTCQLCHATDVPLQAHHLSYDRVGAERADDLRVLCKACHTLRHRHWRGQQPIPTDSITRRRHELRVTRPKVAVAIPKPQIVRRPKQ